MKNKLDITYVIQGPLDVISLDTIDEYLKQGRKVVVSCWDNKSITDKNRGAIGITKEDYKLVEPYLGRITLVKNKYPQNLEEKYFMTPTFYFQQITTLAGLKKVKTKYCVVHKSGDSFPDISPILNKLKNNPNKYYITNRGSHRDHQIKFGMNSDFVLAETKKMIKARELIINFCDFGAQMVGEYCEIHGGTSPKPADSTADNPVWCPGCGHFPHSHQPLLNFQDINGNRIHWVDYAETLETICFLIAAGETIDTTKSAEQVKRHYDITPMKDFKNFKWSQRFQANSDRSSREFGKKDPVHGFRGMNYDKNFSGGVNGVANHIDEIDIQ